MFEQDSLKTPILFPDNAAIKHSDVKIINNYGEKGVPVSAGFCSISNGSFGYTVQCYGESISLNLQSDPKDEEAIRFLLNIQ